MATGVIDEFLPPCRVQKRHMTTNLVERYESRYVYKAQFRLLEFKTLLDLFIRAAERL